MPSYVWEMREGDEAAMRILLGYPVLLLLHMYYVG